MTRLTGFSLLVKDYDLALEWFCHSLNFEVLQDVPNGETTRFVQIAPQDNHDFCLVLMLAQTERQKQLVGRQAGEGVVLFLETDSFWDDYEGMKLRGVKFVESPREEPYATVVIFEDLYGNKWDLLQPKRA